MGPGSVTPDSRAHQTNEVWLEFGDGEYLFKLKLKQIAMLEESCGEGIGTLYARVELGQYYAKDLTEVIRLGLTGGAKGIVAEQELSVSPEKATKLVTQYCDRPLDEIWTIARAVYRACIHGYAPRETKPGKSEASTQTIQEPDGSTSPRPTQTE